MNEKKSTLKYYQQDDGIFVYEFVDSKRATIDEWMRLASANDQLAPQLNQHIRSLYILQSVSLTPYTLKQVIATTNNTPATIHESIAIVVTSGMISSLFSVLFRQLSGSVRSRIKVFSQRDQALEWLHKRSDIVLKQENIAPLTQHVWNTETTPKAE
jgi:hypothetical protein